MTHEARAAAESPPAEEEEAAEEEEDEAAAAAPEGGGGAVPLDRPASRADRSREAAVCPAPGPLAAPANGI